MVPNSSLDGTSSFRKRASAAIPFLLHCAHANRGGLGWESAVHAIEWIIPAGRESSASAWQHDLCLESPWVSLKTSTTASPQFASPWEPAWRCADRQHSITIPNSPKVRKLDTRAFRACIGSCRHIRVLTPLLALLAVLYASSHWMTASDPGQLVILNPVNRSHFPGLKIGTKECRALLRTRYFETFIVGNPCIMHVTCFELELLQDDEPSRQVSILH